MKREVFFFACLIISICFLVIMPFVSSFWWDIVRESLFSQIIGNGIVGFVLLPNRLIINISSPENTTYNFSIADYLNNNFTIDLNVSANLDVDAWWYTLEDVRHGSIVVQDFNFTPNTTINAVRWNNRLTVFANNSVLGEANASVEFFVQVNDSAPLLGFIDNEILVCEDVFLSYEFNATDIDEDSLSFGIDDDSGLFFVTKLNETIFPYLTVAHARIDSGILDKGDFQGANGWRTFFNRNLLVNDGQYADSAMTNITLIEINHMPNFLEIIGVQTVWTQGENSTFYHQVPVNDVESGNQDSGNLFFNLTFQPNVQLFGISRFGVMNYTGNETQIGVYNVSICVIDESLPMVHQNISLCGQNGSAQAQCQNFSLTVTDQNRPPRITSFYPLNSSFAAGGSDMIFFNISKHDPDGTIPDTYWYVDAAFIEYDAFSAVDTFAYNFGCGVSGEHFVVSEITDGELNDSIRWNITVTGVACPSTGVGGGGGGGAVMPLCEIKWVCNDWEACENAAKGLEVGVLAGGTYRDIVQRCSIFLWGEDLCGYQIRDCFDLNLCNKTINKPAELQSCLFTTEPTCSDGIKNCHRDSCEFLVDCGGPCQLCPTCSDGIQNQGETNVDCGGPCPIQCPIEIPKKNVSLTIVFVVVGLFILLLLLIIQAHRIWRLHKKKVIKAFPDQKSL